MVRNISNQIPTGCTSKGFCSFTQKSDDLNHQQPSASSSRIPRFLFAQQVFAEQQSGGGATLECGVEGWWLDQGVFFLVCLQRLIVDAIAYSWALLGCEGEYEKYHVWDLVTKKNSPSDPPNTSLFWDTQAAVATGATDEWHIPPWPWAISSWLASPLEHFQEDDMKWPFKGTKILVLPSPSERTMFVSNPP